MHECEAYWQGFLRRPKEQRRLREEQKHLQKETVSACICHFLSFILDSQEMRRDSLHWIQWTIEVYVFLSLVLDHQACCMVAQRSAKVAELERALLGCTPEQQNLLLPIFKSPGLLERLHDCLLAAERNPSAFSERMSSDQALAALIQEKAEEFRRDPQACKHTPPFRIVHASFPGKPMVEIVQNKRKT